MEDERIPEMSSQKSGPPPPSTNGSSRRSKAFEKVSVFHSPGDYGRGCEICGGAACGVAPKKDIASMLQGPSPTLVKAKLALESLDRPSSLPDDAQCPTCRYWRTDRPEIAEILEARSPGLAKAAQCRCIKEEHKARRRIMINIGEANLPHQAAGQVPRTLDNFNVVDGTAEAVDGAQKFVAGELGANIPVFVGVKGAGKTHLAEGIGRACLDGGETAYYGYTPDLLSRLRLTFSGEGIEHADAVMAWWMDRNVLILDDIGTEKASDWAAEKVTALVDDRYRNGGRLVVGTNLLTQDKMAEHMGGRLASRLWDARTGTVKQVYITAGSYRTTASSE